MWDRRRGPQYRSTDSDEARSQTPVFADGVHEQATDRVALMSTDSDATYTFVRSNQLVQQLTSLACQTSLLPRRLCYLPTASRLCSILHQPSHERATELLMVILADQIRSQDPLSVVCQPILDSAIGSHSPSSQSPSHPQSVECQFMLYFCAV